uniref:Large ribosomal subunit protein bL28c n=1 Tax=Kalanchoe fedtschenkoi TaxID=63787 RepID=A0A7N0UNX1_KALFE
MTSAASGMMVGVAPSLHFDRLKVSARTSLKTAAAATDLRFVTSQFSGIKMSSSEECGMAARLAVPARPMLQPIVARRICPFTGKKSNKANKVSFSNHKTTKLQFVNLQYKRVWWEGGKRFLKLRLSTKAIKTIEKNGLDAVAKKAGIDLRKA